MCWAESKVVGVGEEEEEVEEEEGGRRKSRRRGVGKVKKVETGLKEA